jgi:hypothetical protein
MKNEVWSAVLDDIYECKVIRTEDNRGVLSIRRKGKSTGTLLWETGVNLSYGAAFGPDVYDVAEWEAMCLDFVDNIDKVK